MTDYARNQQGAVALLTAIIISLLLSIVLTGFVVVMVSEQRQSNDSEQSITAYYAAESGVEDAITKVKAGLRTDQTCGAAGSKNLNIDPTALGQVGWSCQNITFTGQPKGNLDTPDSTAQYDLAGANFNRVGLQWEMAAGRNLTPPPAGTLPSAAAWGNRPAAVELTIVSYPKNGTFNSGQISTKNILVVPGSSGGSYALGSALGSLPAHGICTVAGTYKCSISLTGFNGAVNYLIRIRTRYIGTDYQFTFYNGASATNVPDGSATIDVTGKSGDVYRRVIYKVPFTKGAASGLDYVVYSDTDVCKDLSVINGAVQPGSACP